MKRGPSERSDGKGRVGLDPRSGWCTGVRRIASPNFDARPDPNEFDLIVIHAISLPPGEFGGGYIDRLFLNDLDAAGDPYFATINETRVSAHFLIDRLGAATQYVSVRDRAWHAGRSEFRGRRECNDYSIGIELEGCDELPFADLQYAALASLSAELIRGYPSLDSERVIGHCDIAPQRKTDPGPCFDWPAYRALLSACLIR